MSEFFQHYPQISYDVTGAKPAKFKTAINAMVRACLLYTSPSPRDVEESRMPSSA